MSLRIAVDLRPLLDPHESGVTVYTKAMVKAFLSKPNLLVDLFYQASRPCERIHEFFPNARHIPISNSLYHLRSILFFLKLPADYFEERPDLIWIPDRRPFYRTDIPLFMTVHDKVPERLPETLSWKSWLWHRIFPLSRLQKLCSGFLAPSSSTAVDLPKLPVGVTWEGAQLSDEQCTPNGVKELRRKPFFLMISPADPRKRLDWLKEMVLRFPKVHFVVIGLKGGDARFRSVGLEKRKNLFLFGAVSEEEKHWFLKNAEALLALSSYEGFDLPVLEAVRAKCPVILSDIAVHHELYKSKRPMVKTVDDLALEIKYALENGASVPDPRGDFRWEGAANRALLFFRRVVFHKDGYGRGHRNGNDST